jgi:hypothetical protein
LNDPVDPPAQLNFLFELLLHKLQIALLPYYPITLKPPLALPLVSDKTRPYMEDSVQPPFHATSHRRVIFVAVVVSGNVGLAFIYEYIYIYCKFSFMYK